MYDNDGDDSKSPKDLWKMFHANKAYQKYAANYVKKRTPKYLAPDHPPTPGWHFLPGNHRLRWEGTRVREGSEHVIKESELDIDLCGPGYHASERLWDAFGYACMNDLGLVLCRVELSGYRVMGLDKMCGSRRRVLWMVDLLPYTVAWLREHHGLGAARAAWHQTLHKLRIEPSWNHRAVRRMVQSYHSYFLFLNEIIGGEGYSANTDEIDEVAQTKGG